MNADGSDANCQERCCQQSCSEMDVTCPTGWDLLMYEGDYRPEWSSDANWPQSECCYLTCGEAAFDSSTCPANTIAQDDGHCKMLGDSQPDDDHSLCEPRNECCQATCASTLSVTGLVCDTGMVIASDKSCDLPDVTGDDDRHGRRCDSPADADEDNDNGPKGCCFTPYMAGAITNQLSAATAGTDTGYDITFSEYSDPQCTVSMGEFDGGTISGTSATCIPQTHGGDTHFGFFGYCPGFTGTGAYECERPTWH